MIPAEVLRAIRNELPMSVTVRNLGRDGPYGKMIEGFFRFVCPYCHEIRATVNPKNNLAHCFCCQKNINNIDLMMSLGYDFKGAVALLRKWLKEYKQHVPSASDNEEPFYRAHCKNRPMAIGEILSKISHNVGKK